jgi:hypothetical protein
MTMRTCDNKIGVSVAAPDRLTYAGGVTYVRLPFLGFQRQQRSDCRVQVDRRAVKGIARLHGALTRQRG